MPDKLNESIKNFPFNKMFYPAITIFFIAIVVFLLSRSVVFLTGKINEVFIENDNSLQQQITELNLNDYQLIKKRFNLTVQIATSTPVKIASTSIPVIVASSSVQQKNSASTAASSSVAQIKNVDTPAVAAEKAAITIEIFNGPEKNENGAALQTDLVQAGFIGVKMDNHQLVLKNTIIQFKTSNPHLQKYMSQISKILAGKFAAQTGSDLPDNSVYDVSILIGQK